MAPDFTISAPSIPTSNHDETVLLVRDECALPPHQDTSTKRTRMTHLTAESAFPTGTILGYPRIGRRRELKKAVEGFWN